MGTSTRRPLVVEYKSAAAALPSQVGGVIADEDDPMVFDILGSVTGIVDEVKDIVLPGAFERTLRKRTPKIIKDHDWGQRLGKVLQIRELRPGHPDMPGTLPNGDPWPEGAGALLARVRLFSSPEGKQAAERWREDPEQQFSIGYISRKAMQRKSDQVRLLADVDLMEISDVLWGAMPLCGMMPGALATKMLPVDGSQLDDDVDDETTVAFESALHRMGGEQVDWDEVDAAAGGVDDDGRPIEVEPSGDDTQPPPEEDDAEPEGKAAGGADKNRGNAETLRRWYVSGEGAAKIRWGTEGDFDRCVRIASKYMGTRAKGYCALRHRDATGATPGHAPGEQHKVHVAAGVIDSADAKGGYDPTLEVGEFAGTKTAGPAVDVLEVKDYPRFPGTYEERLETVRTAVTRRLRGPEVDQGKDSGGDGPAISDTPRYAWDHVHVDATWPDRVIATRVKWSPGQERTESFEVGYTWDGEHATLGDPTPVRLVITALATDSETGPAYDADPRAGAAALAVKDAAAQLAAAHVEIKSGRVLSSANAKRLQDALQHLLAVAHAAGIVVVAPTEPVTTDRPTGSDVDTETTAPSAREAKTLDRATVDAILARLTTTTHP